METDWVQVVVSLVVGVGVGALLIFNADEFSTAARRQSESMRQPEAARRRMTPGTARAVGAVFIVIGIVGAVLGLFFADEM
ncbi:hypothetical protein [Nocardioides plantarum]|uniref:Uncharacterized protein n=1 Tax=Nocardioides plantarum TaxID=29299 RepID=A0ABV5K8K0_9ACTN|nr:hypothetical protein [Nocardioides plantarum]